MTTFTKFEFDKAKEAAADDFNQIGVEAAMCTAMRKILALDESLIAGRYVKELRQIANRYERMYRAEGEGA